MRLVIRPVHDRLREHDVTRRLVSAIAEELWSLYGGNEHLNWIEAEHHLQRLVEEIRAEARQAQGVCVEPSVELPAPRALAVERPAGSRHERATARTAHDVRPGVGAGWSRRWGGSRGKRVVPSRPR